MARDGLAEEDEARPLVHIAHPALRQAERAEVAREHRRGLEGVRGGAEEGLDAVFARHARHAEATRIAVTGWDLEILCRDSKAYSGSLTAIVMPEGHDADAFRKVALENFNLSLGQGLSKVAGKVFRIGHLGDFNDLMLMGTLSGVEMALGLAKVPHKTGGVQAALTYLKDTAPGARH